ncbi:hypothetical protein LguiB_002479 [Lonicera macranthoides]
MKRNGLLGDNYTYSFVLKSCGVMGGVLEGRQVHGEIVKVGFEWDLFVRNGLIGMYCRCGEMDWVCGLFEGFVEKDLISWNLMLGGYDVAIAVYRLVYANQVKIGDVIRARELFDAMPLRDLVSWNSMAAAYVKVGDMVEAHRIFDQMDEKNVISWSIIIDGYARHGNPKEALNLFRQMLVQGVKPDKISLVGAVLACAQLGALDQGRWIEMYTKKNKMKIDIVVETALVDMYMKCGSISEAQTTFNSMSERNVVTWNVMIGGLSMNGLEEEALKCFAQMEIERIKMDDLVFVSVLTACSHAGFVTKGLEIFDRMRSYGVEPKLEHYGCLIDLLGRAGELEKAKTVIESMPMRPNSDLWGSLLLACRTHRNVGLAQIAVERLAELKDDDAGVYVLLSNIYAEAGMWEGVGRVRGLMRERKMKKEAGKSVIEVDGGIEEFVSGKKARLQWEEIEGVLWNLLKVQVSAE